MTRHRCWFALPLLIGSIALFSVSQAQQPRPAGPRAEPIAETRLLMEGLALPNFRGIDRQLRQKPTEVEAWVFMRGQSLLIAETANLLMLRPPRSGGQEAWLSQAAQLRDTATRLACSAAERDYDRSRAGLAELANACNRCHQTFRVPTRIPPKD